MSSALYLVRLMYHGSKGDMGFHGVHIDFTERPSIMATLGITEIEFTPEVRVSRVRERSIDKWREMTAEERQRVLAYLQNSAVAVRAALLTSKD
jgi:hypothetical protein